MSKIKDCENCRKQPGCMRYLHLATRMVKVTYDSTYIAADCRHFEDLDAVEADAPLQWKVQSINPDGTYSCSLNETEDMPDTREPGCSNCKWFAGFSTLTDHIAETTTIIGRRCNHDSKKDSVLPLLLRVCEHHDWR
jgi:uncharacterized protein YodC (DUF2158 family)